MIYYSTLNMKICPPSALVVGKGHKVDHCSASYSSYANTIDIPVVGRPPVDMDLDHTIQHVTRPTYGPWLLVTRKNKRPSLIASPSRNRNHTHMGGVATDKLRVGLPISPTSNHSKAHHGPPTYLESDTSHARDKGKPTISQPRTRGGLINNSIATITTTVDSHPTHHVPNLHVEEQAFKQPTTQILTPLHGVQGDMIPFDSRQINAPLDTNSSALLLTHLSKPFLVIIVAAVTPLSDGGPKQ